MEYGGAVAASCRGIQHRVACEITGLPGSVHCGAEYLWMRLLVANSRPKVLDFGIPTGSSSQI